jgi:hypothetical protein
MPSTARSSCAFSRISACWGRARLRRPRNSGNVIPGRGAANRSERPARQNSECARRPLALNWLVGARVGMTAFCNSIETA